MRHVLSAYLLMHCVMEYLTVQIQVRNRTAVSDLAS